MANETDLIQDGEILLFADHATDFGATPTTAANSLITGTPTDVQLDLTSITSSGGARASSKVDLGATRPPFFGVYACFEHAVAPTDAGAVRFLWGWSPSATAGTGNPAGLTGSDAAFTDTPGNLAQLDTIGQLFCRNNVINIGYVGLLVPRQRYGMLVTVNLADQAAHTVMDETHIILVPLTYAPGA